MRLEMRTRKHHLLCVEVTFLWIKVVSVHRESQKCNESLSLSLHLHPFSLPSHPSVRVNSCESSSLSLTFSFSQNQVT